MGQPTLQVANTTRGYTRARQDYKPRGHLARKHGENRKIHPFYFKSNWEPPVQQPVALESYLEKITIRYMLRIHRYPKPDTTYR